MSIYKIKMDKEESQHLLKFLEKLRTEVCRGKHLLQHGFDPKLHEGNSLEIRALVSSFKQESHVQAMKSRRCGASVHICPKTEVLESEISYTMNEDDLSGQRVQLENILGKIERIVETFNIETQFVRERQQGNCQTEVCADNIFQLEEMEGFEGTYTCLLSKYSVITEHASRLLEKTFLDRHSLIKMCEEMIGNSEKVLSLDIDSEVLQDITPILPPNQLENLLAESPADTILEKILRSLVDKYSLVSSQLLEAEGDLQQHVQNFSKFQRETNEEILGLHVALESKTKECTDQIKNVAMERLALNNEIGDLKNQIEELRKELFFTREEAQRSREACTQMKERVSYIQDNLVLAGHDFGLALDNAVQWDFVSDHGLSKFGDVLNNIAKYFNSLQDELVSCREKTSKVEKALKRSNLFFNELTEAIDDPFKAVAQSGNFLKKLLSSSEDVIDLQMRAGVTDDDAHACKKTAELLVVWFEYLQNRIGLLSDELSHAEKDKQKTEREKAVAGLCLEYATRKILSLQCELNKSHSVEAYLKEEIQYRDVEIEKMLNRIDNLSDELSCNEEREAYLQSQLNASRLSEAHLKEKIQIEVEKENLQKRISCLSSQLSQSEDSISYLGKEKQKTEKEKAVAVFCLEHAVRSICSFQSQLNESHLSEAQLEKEIEQKETENKKLQNMISDLSAQLSHAIERKANLSNEFQQMEVELKTLQERNVSLSDQLLRTEQSILILENEKQKTETEKIEAALCLERAMGSVESLQSQLNEILKSEACLKEEIQQKEVKHEALQKRIVCLSDQLSQAEQSIFILENEKVRTEKEKAVAGLCLERALRTIQSCQSQLHESHLSEAHLKEQIQQKEVQHKMLHERINNLHEQLSRVEESILVLEKEQEKLQKEKAVAGLCLEHAMKSIQSLKSELNDSHLLEAYMKGQIQQREMEYETLQKCVDSLSKQLSQTEETILNFVGEKEKTEKEKSVVWVCLKHAMKTIESLKYQLNNSHLSEACLKGQIQQREMACETLQKSTTVLCNQLAQTEETILSLEKEKEKTEKEKAVLGLCLEGLMRKIGSIQSQLNNEHVKLQDKIVHLSDRLSHAEDTISVLEKEKAVVGLCLEHAVRSIELLEDQLNGLQQLEVHLKEEIQHNEVKHEKMQKRIGYLSDQLSRSEENILVLGKDKEKTEEEKAVISLCLEHAMRSVGSLHDQLNASYASEECMKEQIQQNQNRICHLTDQLSNVEERISVLEKEKGVAVLCLEHSMRTIKTLQCQVSELCKSEANLKEQIQQKEIEHEKQLKLFSSFLNSVDKVKNHQVILRSMILNEVSRITQVMKWIKGLTLKLLSDVSSLKDNDGNSMLTPYNKSVDECCYKRQIESIVSENTDENGKWNDLEAFLDLKCRGMESELQILENSFKDCVEVSSEDCLVISKILLEISNGLGCISERINSLKRDIEYAASENTEKEKEIENTEMCLMLMVQTVISVNKELERAQGKMPTQQPIKSLVSPAKFSQIGNVYTSYDDLQFLVSSLVQQLYSSVRNLLNTHGLDVSKDIQSVTSESSHTQLEGYPIVNGFCEMFPGYKKLIGNCDLKRQDECILQSLLTAEAKVAELSIEAEELKVSNQDLESTLLRTSTKLHKTINNLNRMWALSENLIKEVEDLHLLMGIREDEISQLREQLFLRETEMTALQIMMDEFRASVSHFFQKE